MQFFGEQRVVYDWVDIDGDLQAAALVFIGLVSSTSFLERTIDLDRWGFIITDDTLQTSLPGAFAAGDPRAGSAKQLGSAVGDGTTALLMVRQYLRKHSHLTTRQLNA